MELLGHMIATPTAGLPFAGILASIVVDSASDFRQWRSGEKEKHKPSTNAQQPIATTASH